MSFDVYFIFFFELVLNRTTVVLLYFFLWPYQFLIFNFACETRIYRKRRALLRELRHENQIMADFVFFQQGRMQKLPAFCLNTHQHVQYGSQNNFRLSEFDTRMRSYQIPFVSTDQDTLLLTTWKKWLVPFDINTEIIHCYNWSRVDERGVSHTV